MWIHTALESTKIKSMSESRESKVGREYNEKSMQPLNSTFADKLIENNRYFL